ncbi:MAG TPA: hypothetical protein VJ691_16820 [Vicinamibacterales bacterium]|nr:hypothetical protein [Vicinamibacterales bacterium]
MPTRPVESTREAEPDHPVQERKAAGVESPSADQMKGANSPPKGGNADDLTSGDQDIDTAGTAHDDLSPTKSL